MLSDDDLESMSREESPFSDSPRHVSLDVENSYENIAPTISSSSSNNNICTSLATKSHSKVKVSINDDYFLYIYRPVQVTY